MERTGEKSKRIQMISFEWHNRWVPIDLSKFTFDKKLYGFGENIYFI